MRISLTSEDTVTPSCFTSMNATSMNGDEINDDGLATPADYTWLAEYG